MWRYTPYQTGWLFKWHLVVVEMKYHMYEAGSINTKPHKGNSPDIRESTSRIRRLSRFHTDPDYCTSALKTNGMQTLFSSVAGIDYQKFSCAVAKESFTSSRSKSVFNSTSGILQLETKQIAMDKRKTPYDS